MNPPAIPPQISANPEPLVITASHSVILDRLHETDKATLGICRILTPEMDAPEMLSVTLENPNRHGKLDDRIVAGIYPLKLWTPESHPHSKYARICRHRYGLRGVVEIADVEDRTACLNHWGASQEHTEGCVLHGRGMNWLPNQKSYRMQSARSDICTWRDIGEKLENVALAGGLMIIRDIPKTAAEAGIVRVA